MNPNEPAIQNRTDRLNDPVDVDLELDARDVRALTECMSVLEDVGAARDAPGLYVVVSQSGREYLVDAIGAVCECPDYQNRAPDGGCKHLRRVAFETGARPIPGWVNRSAIDAHVGAFVTGSPRIAATDGGSLRRRENDEDARDGDRRPDGCECLASMETLPCFACWLEGFETPNPDAPALEE